jgi:hypothetical protein
VKRLFVKNETLSRHCKKDCALANGNEPSATATAAAAATA